MQGIETQATYNAGSQQFVIRTPQNEASKFWIGGAGQHGKVCTVFAQLTVGGKWQGPHVFVVRLRDDAGEGPCLTTCSLLTGNQSSASHTLLWPHALFICKPSFAGNEIS